jgi:hypothetical protein
VLGHNYVGTEHLLVGVLATRDPVAGAPDGMGLTQSRAEELLAAAIAEFQATRKKRA